FTDPDRHDYDQAAAEQTWKVALGFLATL
ncbi:dienelactone hydrolase, partial [Streptomyces californicus]|nr:dienelactone hydrolase [Streptomyces californicus]